MIPFAPASTAPIFAPLQQKEPYEGVAVKRDIAYGPDDRNKLDGLYECILCACCSTACSASTYGLNRLPSGADASPGSRALPWWQERSRCGRT